MKIMTFKLYEREGNIVTSTDVRTHIIRFLLKQQGTHDDNGFGQII